MVINTTNREQVGSRTVFLFYIVLSAYPILSFLWRRSYPFLTAEVFLLLSVIAAFSILLVAVQSWIRPTLKAVLTTLLIVIVLLIQFNLQMEGVLAIVVLITPLAWVLKSRFYLYGVPVLVAMLVGAWVDSRHHPDDFDNSLPVHAVEEGKPPIIHILLDGFIGMDGLPSYPASALFRKEVDRFFQDYGFVTFPRAYSRYPSTGASLYAAMNFRNDGDNRFTLEAQGRRKHILNSNAYFDVLEESGYQFNVYQTAHLDFCQSNRDSTDKCWNYVHPNVLTIRQVDSIFQRASMLAKVIVAQSFLLKKATFGLGFENVIAVYDPRVFKVMQEDILANPMGRVFFAHLLLPHNPFVYLHDCSVRYDPDPSMSYAMASNDRYRNPKVFEYRTMRYFEQAECALVTLRQMFEEMKLRAIFDQAFIVIHGDHGSQIASNYPTIGNLKTLTYEDYRAHYSTLFAVKLPFGKSNQDSRSLPISTLLEEFVTAAAMVEQGHGVATEPMEIAPQNENKLAPFIYLLTPNGLKKVDIDIFDD